MQGAEAAASVRAGVEVVYRAPERLLRRRGLKGNTFRLALAFWNVGGCRAGAELDVCWGELAGGLLPDATPNSVRRTVLEGLVDLCLVEVVAKWTGGARLRLVDPAEAEERARRLRLADVPRQRAFPFADEGEGEEVVPRSLGVVRADDAGPGPLAARVLFCDPPRAARDRFAARDRAPRAAGDAALGGAIPGVLEFDANGSDGATLRAMLDRQREAEGGLSGPFGARRADIHVYPTIPGISNSPADRAGGGGRIGPPLFSDPFAEAAPRPPGVLQLFRKRFRSVVDYEAELYRILCATGARNLFRCVTQKVAIAVAAGLLPPQQVERAFVKSERRHLETSGREDPGKVFVGCIKTKFVDLRISWQRPDRVEEGFSENGGSPDSPGAA